MLSPIPSNPEPMMILLNIEFAAKTRRNPEKTELCIYIYANFGDKPSKFSATHRKYELCGKIFVQDTFLKQCQIDVKI